MNRLSFAVAALIAVAVPASALDAGVRIVGHPSIGGTQVKRETLAAVYLNRAAVAPNGRSIVPVDQSAKSPVRASFSINVLAQPVAAVQVYWIKQISAGARPPVVKGSDAEVLAYVAATPGAIGYVSTATPIEADVRELHVID